MNVTDAKLISKELYEAAGDAYMAARERMDKANAEATAAETALYEAESALAAQEAAPGIPAYWHATVPAGRCRIGSRCTVHNPPGEDPW